MNRGLGITETKLLEYLQVSPFTDIESIMEYMMDEEDYELSESTRQSVYQAIKSLEEKGLIRTKIEIRKMGG